MLKLFSHIQDFECFSYILLTFDIIRVLIDQHFLHVKITKNYINVFSTN